MGGEHYYGKGREVSVREGKREARGLRWREKYAVVAS